MNPLNDYINQARSRGQSDDQIRQSLSRSGWPPDQIDAGLNIDQSASPAATPGPPEHSLPTQPRGQATQARSRLFNNKNRIPVILSLLAFVILVVIGFVLIGGNKTSYQTVANEFITSVQNNDQAKANSLESPEFKNNTQTNSGTTSFDSYCHKEGELCTAFFNKSYLAKARVIDAAYADQYGNKGKSLIYSVATSPADVCVQNFKTSGAIEIDLLPSGSSWLVDNISVDGGINGTINKCPK